jgi:hypothetical protein
METLAAVGLAGNILQFVDFAGKVVSKSGELYKSANGALSESAETKQVAEDLKLLADKLCDPISAQSADVVLEELCSGCKSIADELLTALAKLEVKGKHRQFQSLRKALKSVWNGGEIASIESHLSVFPRST